MSTVKFSHTPGGKYKIVSGSVWQSLKRTIQGPSKLPQDEMWIETENIKLLRRSGAIFISDHFLEIMPSKDDLILLYGGYGSSKTTVAITKQLIKAQENAYHRCFYGRNRKTEARNLLSNIITEIKRNGWQEKFDYSEKPNGSTEILCVETGNKFQMFGCDDDESLKGIDNPTDILLDEINQVSFETFGMLYTRLRGSGYETQFTGCFNNCDVYDGHWLKKYLFSDEIAKTEEERAVQLMLENISILRHHSNYLHNQFQNNVKYYYSLILKAGGDKDKTKAYADGEWGVNLAAQPFYKQFNPKREVFPEDQKFVIDGYVDYNPDLPIHISWDENVNPYLPALIAQISGNTVYIIDEIAGENPNNTLIWTCGEIIKKYFYELGHRSGCYLYGDATSEKDDVKLEKGANFFTIAIEYLDKLHPILRKQDANPNVNMRGLFINAVFSLNYENIRVIIHPKCKKLINDLKNCPEDPGGKGKDKSKSKVKGIRGVQLWGHFSDCFDYLMCEYFMAEYLLYQNGGRTYDVKGGKREVANTMEIPKKVKKIENDGEDEEVEISYGRKINSRNGYS